MKEIFGIFNIKKIFIVIHILVSCLLFSQQTTENKFALVIGNSDYVNVQKLKNPANDAHGMKNTLEELGFQVDMLIDANIEQIEDALTRLSKNIKNDGTGFFHFSGHGVQIQGVPYILPVDCDTRTASLIERTSISLYDIQRYLEDSGKVNILVLDANADTPSFSNTRGLAIANYDYMDKAGFITVISASRGQYAWDGDGEYGLFTDILMRNLKIPFLEIKDVLTRTIAETRLASNGQQVPEYRVNYYDNVYLAGIPQTMLQNKIVSDNRIDPKNRFALVIGNSSYSSLEGALPNCKNDAEDMAEALNKLGYRTSLVINANRRTMQNAILSFKDNLMLDSGNSMGFFWYAGHGVQLNGENYLVPIDSGITRKEELETEAMPLSFVMSRLSEVNNPGNLVVLDACRNNPYAFNNRGGNERGLSIINNSSIPQSSMVLYSTAANMAALDGETGQRNSPFTKAFLKFLSDPREFDSVYRDISRETMSLTDQRQSPTRYGQFLSEFYLVPIKENN